MEQQTQKKEWKMPELIVLVRSKPEEAVLSACKMAPVNGADFVDEFCNDYGPSLDKLRDSYWQLAHLPLDPLAFGPWESVREGGVHGPCRGMQGV